MNVNYHVYKGLSLFFKPCVGLYDNYMTNQFNADMTDASGNHYVGTNATYVMNYPVHSHCNEFSLLTQIDAGLEWQFTQCLSARIGYRVLAATGIGLADNQNPALPQRHPVDRGQQPQRRVAHAWRLCRPDLLLLSVV